MLEFIGPFVIGIVCIILGISNRKGNIKSLHSYHRKRVLEKDKIPFGRMVGLGTIIIGSSIIAFDILTIITSIFKMEIFTLIGNILLIIGFITGFTISLLAMIKYNKGIF